MAKVSPIGKTKKISRNSFIPIRKGQVSVLVSNIRSAERIRELESRILQEDLDKESAVERIQQIINDFSKKHGLVSAEQERTERQLITKDEELQAALSELSEVRSTLSSLEHKYCHLQKRYDKLFTETNELKKELDEIRSELMERRRRSITRKPLDLNQFFNTNVEVNENTDENMGLVVLQQLSNKVDILKEENKKLVTALEAERTEHKALQRDLHTAVKVAERGREEAQAEIARWMDSSRMYASADSKLWAELMRKFDENSKRNALLAWTQAHLTAYPSLSVSNFSSDWTDGRCFCALIHNIRPDLIDRADLSQGDCSQLAVNRASELGININPEVFANSTPDWKHIMATVFELYKKYETEGEK